MTTPKIQALYFYGAILSFCAGVLLASLTHISPELPTLFILVGIFLSVFLLVRKSDTILFSIPLFLIFLSIGLIRIQISDVKPVLEDFLFENEKMFVEAQGIVISEATPWSRGERFVVEIRGSDNSMLNNRNHTERILVFGDRYPEIAYGDVVSFRGDLILPENFETKTGREFAYVNFLAKDKIYYQMFTPELEIIGTGEGSWIKKNLFSLKDSFLNALQKVIPEPHVSLLGGVTVGAEESLGAELEDDFRKTGLIHIVVLSGYNVTIVAEFIMDIFAFLPRFVSISLGALSIILFALMTGASATIIRASIMACLVLLSRVLRRRYTISRALALAGFVMVFINPLILVFDPSFQLSFLATIGLVYVSPMIEKYFTLLPKKWGIRDAGVATIATQLFILPFLIYLMGEVSIISFVVNVLVLPVIPITMLLGLITGIFGWLWKALAFVPGLITFGFLEYTLSLVEFFADLPFASVKVGWFPFWLVVVVYVLYMIVLRKNNKSSDQV